MLKYHKHYVENLEAQVREAQVREAQICDAQIV